MIVTLLSSVYVFLALCRRAARRGETFFHLSFEKTYDEKGRLDLVPKGSLDESSEEYKAIYDAYGFCFGMFFLSCLAVMFSLGNPNHLAPV